MRAFQTATETVAAPPLRNPSGPPGAPAIVLGGSEDSRLLLRGLLRLHRHRVLLEGPTHEGIERVPVSPDQKVLVLDAGTGKSDSSFSELQAALQGRGDLSAIVILPSADPALEAKAREAGAKTILVRPFAIRDFIQAVDSVGTPSATT